MAIIEGILTQASGKVGNMTFKNYGNRTVLCSNYGERRNPKSSRQAEQRLKFCNITNIYRRMKDALHMNFQNRTATKGDYHCFMSNLSMGEVYLNRQEAMSGCVVAPYYISFGTLPSINYELTDGVLTTSIQTTPESISAEATVGTFSSAIIATNSNFSYGDIIRIILCHQQMNKWFPYVDCDFVDITLNKHNQTPLHTLLHGWELSISNEGSLSVHFPHSSDIAAGILYKRITHDKHLMASSQVLAVDCDLYEQYHSPEALEKAKLSYKYSKNE